MNLDIYKSDIELVKILNSTTYPKLTMKGSVSDKNILALKALQTRLKNLSDFFKKKYDPDYGIFKSARASGNPVGRTGILRRVWSGIYKGTYNKQYSAQISFVINTEDECLDVGFYFGRASSQDMKKPERIKLEDNLKQLGFLLFKSIGESDDLKSKYQMLFDLGFRASVKGERVNPEKWLSNTIDDPKHSSITISLYPDSTGLINLLDIDACVALAIPLMLDLPDDINTISNHRTKRTISPLTAEQRAKQAEMRAKIGLEGEKFAMDLEMKNLILQGLERKGYPDHKALISDNYGYDILSHNGSTDIYIEVKTTSRLKGEYLSEVFFMSVPEYKFYNDHISTYKLYRVYDIFGDPELHEIDLNLITPEINGYKMIIPR